MKQCLDRSLTSTRLPLITAALLYIISSSYANTVKTIYFRSCYLDTV